MKDEYDLTKLKRRDSPKPLKKRNRTVTCEWCEAPAYHRYSVGPDYIRFSCGEHRQRTERLMILDGHEESSYCTSSQPFTREVLE